MLKIASNQADDTGSHHDLAEQKQLDRLLDKAATPPLTATTVLTGGVG